MNKETKLYVLKDALELLKMMDTVHDSICDAIICMDGGMNLLNTPEDVYSWFPELLEYKPEIPFSEEGNIWFASTEEGKQIKIAVVTNIINKVAGRENPVPPKDDEDFYPVNQ